MSLIRWVRGVVVVVVLAAVAVVVGEAVPVSAVPGAPSLVGAPELWCARGGSIEADIFETGDSSGPGVAERYGLVWVPSGATVSFSAFGLVTPSRYFGAGRGDYGVWGRLIDLDTSSTLFETGPGYALNSGISWGPGPQYPPVLAAQGFIGQTWTNTGGSRVVGLAMRANRGYAGAGLYWSLIPTVSGGSGAAPPVCSPESFRESELYGPNPAMRYQCPCQETVADPVDTRTGLLHMPGPGLVVAGRGPSVGFESGYNSANGAVVGALGAGWSSTLDVELLEEADGSRTVVQETGSTVRFVLDGVEWVSAGRVSATLVENVDGSFTFGRNRSEFFTFDAGGRLVEVADRFGNASVLSYPSSVSREAESMEDGAGRELLFGWAGGFLESVTDFRDGGEGGPRVVEFVQDGSGDLVSVTDVGGGVWSYGYDGSHRMTSMRRPRHVSTPSAAVTMGYDGEGRVVWQEDELGRRTELDFSWSAVGYTTTTFPDGSEQLDRFVGHRRVSTTTALDSDVESVTTVEYDPVSWGPTAIIDGAGERWAFGYDAEGNRVWAEDPLGRISRWDYDSWEQVTLESTGELRTGPTTTDTTDMVVRTFDYDATFGRLETVTAAVGSADEVETSFEYGDGTHPEDVTEMVDGRGQEWAYGYDDDTGVRVEETDPLGHTTTYELDSLGQVVSMVSPRGNESGATPADFETVYKFDDRGLLVEEQNPVGDITRSSYDANGNLVATETGLSTTDNTADVTTYTYDDADQLVEREEPGSVVVSYTYDDMGRRASFTDANSQVWSYAYDEAGRLVAETDPLARTTAHGYDGAGRLVQTLQPVPGATCGGSTPVGCISYSYDDAGQLAGVDYSDPATPDVGGVVYDRHGRRSSATVGTATESWDWDDLGRLVEHTDVAGRVTGYGWNETGQLTEITYPAQSTPVTYGYDAAGRATTVTDWSGRVTTLGYDASSNWTSTVFPGSVNEDDRGYDAAGQLTDITWKQGSTVLGTLASPRDNKGLVTAITATAGPPSRTYGYDARAQLTGVDTATLDYDPAGNLTATEDGRLQVFDPAAQLCWSSPTATTGTCSTPAGDATTYTYDEFGNRTSMTYPSGTQASYGYDQANRMTTAVVPDRGLSTDGQYRTLTVSTIADTTAPSGVCNGGTCGRLGASSTTTIQATGLGTVPAVSAVVAVTGTITVVDPGADGTLDINPNGDAAAATVTYSSGTDTAMTFVAAVDGSGRITVATSAATDVRIDIAGYFATEQFVPSSNYWPTDPAVLADTNNATGVCDGSTCTTLSANQTVQITAAGQGDIPSDATAVVISVIAFNHTTDGVLTVAPNGAAAAGALYLTANTPGSAAITAPLDANGDIALHTTAAGDVLVHISGWFSPPSTGDVGNALELLPAPTRITDTTSPTGICDDGTCGRLAVNDTVEVAIAGQSPVPAAAVAAVVNITFINPTGGAAIIGLSGTNPAAAAATMLTNGTDTAQTATVPLNDDGTLTITSLGAATDFAIDVIGTYTPAVDTWIYTYDSTGLRAAKQENNTTPTEFTWNVAGSLPLLLSQHQGTETIHIIYGPDATPLYQINSNGNALYLHQDHQRSTRLVTTSTGTLHGRIDYDAYGRTTNDTTPWLVTRPLLGYTSEYTDTETGYIYLRARYHDPTTGQFTSRDPLVAASESPHGYGDSNPVVNSDPSGLLCVGSVCTNTIVRGASQAVSSAVRTVGRSAVRRRHSAVNLAIGVGAVTAAGALCVGSAGIGCPLAVAGAATILGVGLHQGVDRLVDDPANDQTLLQSVLHSGVSAGLGVGCAMFLYQGCGVGAFGISGSSILSSSLAGAVSIWWRLLPAGVVVVGAGIHWLIDQCFN